MKVGILGSGDVGRALAEGFVGRGHDVMMGTRSPEKLSAFSEEHPGIRIEDFSTTAGFGETVVLATRGAATVDLCQGVGAEVFAGKVVIDATNPLDFSDGPARMFVGFSDSLGEQIQRVMPDARVVKCWNIITSTQMVDPTYEEGSPDMLICGNDDMAKASVKEILRSFGWREALDLGSIEMSRYLEPLCLAWVQVGMALGSWSHAFSILKR